MIDEPQKIRGEGNDAEGHQTGVLHGDREDLEFLTGPRKFDEVMEKLEIIVDDMMADDGPIPMDLGEMSVRTTRRRHRAIRTRATKCHMKTCAPCIGKGTKPAREQARKD